MKPRILLAEIPSKEFHSAIFTTYSINLYYLEQQVLPLLGNKGIHYVSVLVDSNMLSSQLDTLSSLSENRKRNYSINGMRSKGAFHSKLIFLAGDNKLLLLMGSGNLTSSGHGKNLEVWNAFYVESVEDPKLGFLLQAWNYIKELHKELGTSSSNKIKSIEDNCSLLKSNAILHESYILDDDTQISFLYAQAKKSIFNQLTSSIGSEKIKRITVMSPFYDTDGKFLKLLNDTFEPETIHVILQKEFGNAPTNLKPTGNMHFHNWEDVKCDVPQKFFHAKNIVFEGELNSYLLSGSANASIAAFGLNKTASVNHEACVLYQSESTDFIKVLGIKLKKKKEDLDDYIDLTRTESTTSTKVDNLVYIQYAERNYDIFTLKLSSEKDSSNINLCIFDAKGKLQIEKTIDLNSIEERLTLTIQHSTTVMYCCLKQDDNVISNRQFITDIHAFESTNPSQKNRSLNELRKLIETEGFSTLKIIDYLSEIYHNKKPNNYISASSNKKINDDEIYEVENELLHLSYQQIKDHTKHFDNSRNGRAYVEYQSVRLWESIIGYIKDSKERNEQLNIDEEETENINESSGRDELVIPIKKIAISRKVYEKKKLSIEKFLKDYIKTIESNIENPIDNKPSLIDLSMYLIMLEVLIQHANTKELIFEESNSKEKNEIIEKKEEFLLHPKISNSDLSWSGLTLKIMGLFNLWWNKSEGFKDVESQEYKDKFIRYETDAFNMSVMAITLFEQINKNHIESNKIRIWTNIELLNCLHCFSDQQSFSFSVEDYLMFLNEKETELADSNQDSLRRNLDFLKGFINNPKFDNNYLFQKGSGFMYWNSVFGSATSNKSLYKINPSLLFMR